MTFEYQENKMNKKILLASLLAASQMSFAQSEIQWIDAPELKTLSQLPQEKSLTANKWQQDAVRYNMDLTGQDIKASKNSGFVAESKSFYMDVSGKQLNAGFNIPVYSNTAVIRLSSLNRTTVLDGSQIALTQDKSNISTKVMATGSDLKEIGMEVPENTIAMKVTHQPGNLQLKLNNNDKALDDKFIVHVFEPDSPYRLAVATSKQTYQAGETLTVKANLLNDKASLPMQMQGYITKPNGEKFADLNFKADKFGQIKAELPQLPFASQEDGLWEVHTVAQGNVAGNEILRDVSTSFAVTVPTAQFNGQLNMSDTEITLGVENLLAARYEINGLLMGHDKAGQQKPIAMLMSADWLKQGTHNISFELPQELIKTSGLVAPFVVKNVSLKNQTLMSPVQEVTAGFTFDIQ